MRIVRDIRATIVSSQIRVSRRLLFCGVLGVALSFSAARSLVYAGADDNDLWIGTWGTSPQEPDVFPGFPSAPSFNNQSIRQIVRISTGGKHLRVRLTNEYGSQPLLIGAAHIGISAGGSSIKPGSDRVLKFSGQTSILIPANAPILK